MTLMLEQVFLSVANSFPLNYVKFEGVKGELMRGMEIMNIC